MELKSTGTAGTLESSDVMVTIAPSQGGLSIELKSTVEDQYGRQIKAVIEETLKELGVTAANVTATDRGALDCTISARVKTAVYRASGREDYQWEVKKA